MQLKAALFDLDDTLHDKSATLRKVGARQYREADLAGLGVNYENWLSEFIELNNLRIEKSEVFSRLSQAFQLSTSVGNLLLADFDANLGASAVPYPGAYDLLNTCKELGLKVGVVTNGRDAFQRSKLDGMGLSPLVDVVTTSGAFGIKKPDPRIFLECLSALHTPPNEAVFVGDNWAADIEPSIALGMRAIFKSPSLGRGAWRCTDNLHEISMLIRAT